MGQVVVLDEILILRSLLIVNEQYLHHIPRCPKLIDLTVSLMLKKFYLLRHEKKSEIDCVRKELLRRPNQLPVDFLHAPQDCL